MARRWVIVLPLLALIGCELDTDRTTTPQRPGMERMATINNRMSKLQMELTERDLRIKELTEHVERLSVRLKKAEFINEQLSKQLVAVGDAPRDRDRYKGLTVQQGLEIQRLQRRIEDLRKRLGRTTASAPATQPAS
ncbi:MAG: hypothetical protein AMJ81_00570 [Phycisphaerae bacterium SM23_33]|nr:MAG: hypothetical protein AMJ81_00570 [Phycisphaerae bacterium SM23_33]